MPILSSVSICHRQGKQLRSAIVLAIPVPVRMLSQIFVKCCLQSSHYLLTTGTVYSSENQEVENMAGKLMGVLAVVNGCLVL